MNDLAIVLKKVFSYCLQIIAIDLAGKSFRELAEFMNEDVVNTEVWPRCNRLSR